jgi:DNA-binding NarL/FixJ family response regulator
MTNQVESTRAPGEVLTVVVADDDRLTALTLADSLSRHGLKVLATVHTASDAIAAVTTLRPDVLVVDLDFGPGPTGIDVAQKVRRVLPDLGLVIVTAYEDPRLLAPDLPDAPAGSLYLVKQQVANPEQVAMAAKLSLETATNPPKKDTFKKGVSLSNSQIELLRLVALGLTNQAIADNLSLTPDTVKKGITRLAKRVGVDHTSESNVRVALTKRYLQHSGYNRA